MENRVCNWCQAEFTASSRHRSCPKCRSKTHARFDLCDCGRRKRTASARCLACSNQGEFNGNWRGGKTYHKAGYVMVRVQDHPRALGKNVRYVFEHILVMEEHLGRYLYPDENVHHKHGVKDDNRLEQLELWVKPQPTGIRVEDALAWAKEMIRRYDQ